MFITIIIIVIFILLILDSLNKNSCFSENFKNNEPKTIIGQSKVVQTSLITRAIPNIIPLRKHPPTWIVNVPLRPFRAPLKKHPPVGELPPFMLYKPQYLSEIEDQGDCGSCFAFSVSHMLADRLSFLTLGAFKSNVSVQQLISCYDKNACDGGSPEELCIWIANNNRRFNTMNLVPFKQKSGGIVQTDCKELVGYKVGIAKDSVRTLVEFIEEKNYDENILRQNVLNMKRELANEGPFYCAMTVYDDFFTYTGLKPYKPSKHADLIGGHAIEIIGYCDAGVDPRKDFKDAYWICRNSWGTGWPTKAELVGYFMIPMGKNMCGIESRCGSATPELYGYVSPITKSDSLDKYRYNNINEYLKK